MKITTNVEISDQQIADQIVTALEGGSNYWVQWAKLTDQNGKQVRKIDLVDHPELVPTTKLLLMEDEGDEPVEINYDKIKTGLEKMAEVYPNHFSDLINETGDATTADVFIQMAAFGELVYG